MAQNKNSVFLLDMVTWATYNMAQLIKDMHDLFRVAAVCEGPWLDRHCRSQAFLPIPFKSIGPHQKHEE